MKRLLKDSQGMALVVAVFVTAILMTLTGASLLFSQLDLKIASHHRTGIMAFFASEAGLNHAWREVDNGDGVRDFDQVHGQPAGYQIVPNSSFSGGTYEVTLLQSTNSPRMIQVASVGTAPNNSQARLEVWFKKSAGSNPFTSSAFGSTSLRIGSGGKTDSYNSASSVTCPPGSDAGYCVARAGNNGDVASNGNISLDSGARVNGDATAGGTVSLGTGAGVCDTCTITDGAPQRTLEPVDATYRTPNSNATGITIVDPGAGGDTRYDSVTRDLKLGTGGKVRLSPGTYYFRSLTLDETAKLIITGDVTIYLTGVFKTATASQANVDSSPQTKFNLPSRMVVYSSCTNATATSLGYTYCVDVDGGSGFSGGVYVPNGNIRTDHGGNVYGSMIGGSISNDSGTNFHYDQALANLPGTSVSMAGWYQRF